MKHLLFIFILLTITGCAFQTGRGGVIANFESTGEIIIRPDIARFSATVKCIDKDINVARDCVAKETNGLSRLLEAANISKDDYHSTAVNLKKEYYWKQNTQVFKGYSSSVSMHVTVRDIGLLNQLYGQLLGYENLTLSGLSYSHSKIDQARRDSYVKALKNIEALALRFQTEIGGKSLELLEVSNVSGMITGAGPVRAEHDMAPRKLSATVNVNVGTLVVRERLQARYRILK